MWPSLRSVSIPRPSSCARPARSAVVVRRNSVMICGIVVAQEFTPPVQATQPSPYTVSMENATSPSARMFAAALENS